MTFWRIFTTNQVQNGSQSNLDDSRCGATTPNFSEKKEKQESNFVRVVRKVAVAIKSGLSKDHRHQRKYEQTNEAVSTGPASSGPVININQTSAFAPELEDLNYLPADEFALEMEMGLRSVDRRVSTAEFLVEASGTALGGVSAETPATTTDGDFEEPASIAAKTTANGTRGSSALHRVNSSQFSFHQRPDSTTVIQLTPDNEGQPLAIATLPSHADEIANPFVSLGEDFCLRQGYDTDNDITRIPFHRPPGLKLLTGSELSSNVRVGRGGFSRKREKQCRRISASAIAVAKKGFRHE